MCVCLFLDGVHTRVCVSLSLEDKELLEDDDASLCEDDDASLCDCELELQLLRLCS